MVIDMLWELGQVHYLCVQGTKFLVFFRDSKKKKLSPCFRFLTICPRGAVHRHEGLPQDTRNSQVQSMKPNSAACPLQATQVQTLGGGGTRKPLPPHSATGPRMHWGTLCLETLWYTCVTIIKPQRASSLNSVAGPQRAKETRFGELFELHGNSSSLENTNYF